MELQEIESFLKRFDPFRQLARADLGILVQRTEIRYFRRDSMIIDSGEQNDFLNIIRSGAVELRLGGTELSNRLGEGQCFGYPSLLRDDLTRNQVIALEDSLIYRVPKDLFLRLHADNESFRNFFLSDESLRLRQAVKQLREQEKPDGQFGGSSAKVERLLRRNDMVSTAPETSILDAARLMADKDVSTLPIIDSGKLVGIVTDKDLRRRVLAAGLSTDTAISSIMTANPITVRHDSDLMRALLIMSTNNIHHLPVENAAGKLVGVLGASDLLNRFGTNALNIVAEIRAAPDETAVAKAAARLPALLVNLVESGVDSEHASRFISSVGEAAHQRLIALAEAELGPPPVPYALVIFGSLARQEQAIGSDQDNGFILDDEYEEEIHGAYFEKLATRLCDGLNSAGYVYCPGDIMATNPKWRKPLSHWRQRYHRWMENPDPDNILNTTIFFDMRGVAGETELVDALRSEIFERSQVNRIFLSFVARAASSTQIPLGFFRNFLLHHDEQEGDVLDLKHHAIAPMVDIARVHALSQGILAVNTHDRLLAAAKEGGLSEEGAADLVDCFEFIRGVRFRHQAEQIRAGERATNNLAPQQLSRFEREHLKDAFDVIRGQLEAINRNLAGGII